MSIKISNNFKVLITIFIISIAILFNGNTVNAISLNGSSKGVPVEPVKVKMNAKTAGEFAGQDYAVELKASMYVHVDENGNSDSNKWAVIVHPFLLKGETIASSVGPFYYEKGYNILAPDLRGFGDSKGSVALGCLESLDIYDWLNVLNDKYHADQIIVHGVSLGAATTNFLSGIDQFMANGPTKINTLKSLKDLNVIGLVEDCGYTDMVDFANESFLLNLNIGLTEENFEYYSKATNSLKYCDLPMLIIHGTVDTTVKFENANIVKNTVKGPVEFWEVKGGVHAFIIMGSKTEEYREHVHDFIDKYESVSTTPITPVVPEVEEEKEEPSMIQRLVKALKAILGLLDIIKI